MYNAAYYLVIDLEATCDEEKRIRTKEMETIEIGAVLVDGDTLEPVDELQTFIKPVRHPILTPFCTKLTSIKQSDVEQAPRFPEAMARVRKFIAGRPALFCSWGVYDKHQFEQDAHYHKVSLPFGKEHLNLKKRFSEVLDTDERFGMAGALRRVGLRLIGTHHRGIDDARNIARLLPWVLGRRQAPPLEEGSPHHPSRWQARPSS
jgi:inhibitor of KinA sporulation pathway (predicted exonuclease)